MVCICPPQHIAGTVHLLVIQLYPESLAWVVCRASAATSQGSTRGKVGIHSRHCYNKHMTCSHLVLWSVLQVPNMSPFLDGHRHQLSSSVSAITRLRADWLENQCLIPEGGRLFSLLFLQISSVAYPATCAVGTGGCFLGGRMAWVWRWPLTSM